MTSDRLDANALRARFYEELPGALDEAARRIIGEAAGSGGVYAVAGVVRDLLLGRRPLDFDFVTEADARDVARRAFPSADITTHDRFLTATVEVETHRIDLATARRETYARPGALPDIESAGIEDDLRRRDFTMNALALRLDDEAALLDPTGGVADIDARLVRVLHDGSFEDDATRIFRAFRYAARLGFKIEPRTLALIESGTRYIETIGGERLRHELHLLFEESTGGNALESLDASGAVAAIHPALRWTTGATSALLSQQASVSRVEAGFALLASGAQPHDADAIVERLQLSREEADGVRGIVSLTQAADMLRRTDVKPSGVVALLDRYPATAVEAFAALTDDDRLRDLLHRYLHVWRNEKPILTGLDLQEMGVPVGPQIGRGLQLLRAARLDGWATDRDDERALIMRFAKSIRDSRAMNQPLDFKLYEN